MNTFKRALLGLSLSLGLVAHAGATTVDLTADGQWHTFDVDSFSSLSGGLEWIDYTDGSVLSFRINNSAPVLLTVADGGFAGDIFLVKDGNVSLGSTSAAVNNYPVSIGLDFDSALSNPLYSKGSFVLAPGSHLITGVLTTSALSDFGALDATVGGVMLQAVPEPAEWATLAAGLFLLSVTAQRSRRK
ncbi:hypothetical protein VVD49_13630 [Uliginosibacterium sp. H3]|uniref:PEP-CTERM sorting domain-containing protein n=1 Tax=Uliginosibacterium silvisoli TaxID=3114758 RepID=A0ABU6K4X6_9RHOO|nr:hypothetical protein [Uliginosibacterium sp. H3]